MAESDFRFQGLEIWQLSIDISDRLFDIADKANNKKLFRFAEQLRAAGMSISNNIAEGSGSYHKKEFAQFLNISGRSVFECANILIIFEKRKIVDTKERQEIFGELILLSKKITNFRKILI